MALISKDKGGEGFEPVPAGPCVARCVSVVDIGIQQTPWGGKEKVYIGFEVPSVRVEWKDKDGKEHTGPALIGSRYTNSINEKAILGQHLESWRGKPFTKEERDGFDLTQILGAPCMINVVHTEKDNKVYANIKAIMRLPKGTECPQAETELVAYTPGDPVLIKNFDKLPEWLQKVAREGHGKAADYPTDATPEPRIAPENLSQDPADYFDDDIPFN